MTSLPDALRLREGSPEASTGGADELAKDV